MKSPNLSFCYFFHVSNSLVLSFGFLALFVNGWWLLCFLFICFPSASCFLLFLLAVSASSRARSSDILPFALTAFCIIVFSLLPSFIIVCFACLIYLGRLGKVGFWGLGSSQYRFSELFPRRFWESSLGSEIPRGLRCSVCLVYHFSLL